MFIFRNFKNILFALFFVGVTVQLSQAAATITVEQSGAVNGNNIDGVAGIDLTINYDISKLSSPTVTKGSLVSKGILAANTSSPGVIRIAILSSPPTTPFSGSGQIASISFASNAGNGGIKSVSASIIDSKGTQMPVQASVGTSITPASPPDSVVTSATVPITTPGIPFTQTPTTKPATTTTGYVSTITIQTDTLKTSSEPMIHNERKEPTQERVPQPEPVNAKLDQTFPANKLSVESKTDEPGQYVIFKGIVERFKAYRGDKSLPIMSALFSKEISKFIRQEPAVALSDGKSRIKIIIDIPARNTTSPNFALDNATILSVKKEGGENRRWIIEAMPEVTAWKATLSVISGEESFEYPLTVAPALGGSIKTDQAGWNLFLKESGTPQKVHFDFNNDGVRNYIDEFIFVANHLARK